MCRNQPSMPCTLMVQGSPGMEQGQAKDAYEVMLFSKDGKPSVFARH